MRSPQTPQDIVVRPLITEKTLRLAEQENAYTFEASLGANKVQIRDAIQELFDVKVADVRTANYLGKFRRLGRSFGSTPNWKKAVVRLQEGDTIEFY